MPASVRAHLSRRNSSRPYDRRSPITRSKAQSPPPASSIEDPECPPDHPGLPTYTEYKRIEAGYLLSLSPRKRDKALITQVMFDKIWDVLHQPDACTIETPQFRFWVRKMFTLSRPESDTGEQWQWQWGSDWQEEAEADRELERAMGIGRGDGDAALLTTAVVLHENRPVAIMEQLYELFCYCHVRAGHGGRDKTCAVIREHYSWVPKELTAQFVKACPTCALKRSGGGELGVMLQRRVVASVAGKEKRGAVPISGHTAGSPTSLEWPTTGGPLDPANPQPCGMRARLLKRVDPGSSSSSSLSPGSEVPAPNEISLDTGSRRMNTSAVLDAPPGGVRRTSRPISIDPANFTANAQSPDKTGGLPPLVSALSNESLDDDVNLTRLSPHNDDGGTCLPPALRPLRLSGPVPNIKPEDPDLFLIDPVLLSFSYPGLQGSASPGRSPVSRALVPTGAGTPEARGYSGHHRMAPSGLHDHLCVRLRCARESGDDHAVIPAFTMPDLPPMLLERANKPCAEVLNSDTNLTRYGRYDNHDYSYSGYSPDGSLARVCLLPCAANPDSPGQEMDGTLSRYFIS